MIDSYISRSGIPYEDGGFTIRSLCRGRAKQVLDDEFGTTENPDSTEVKRVLRDHFGIPHIVMTQIIKAHKRIGSIPEPIPYGSDSNKIHDSAKKILDKTRSHQELIKKSEPFRENKIGEYTRELVDMLPTLERNDYLKKSHQYQCNVIFHCLILIICIRCMHES